MKLTLNVADGPGPILVLAVTVMLEIIGCVVRSDIVYDGGPQMAATLVVEMGVLSFTLNMTS